MAHVVFIAGVLLAATLYAACEVQAEGPYGWAGRMPTWRVRNRWTRWFFSSRPLTGYHFYLLCSFVVLAHMPFFAGLVQPSLLSELRVISFLMLFWVAEDFIWFVLNPAFGLKRFRRDCIWWHAPSWWWIMPRDYWLLTPIGIALYVTSHVL